MCRRGRPRLASRRAYECDDSRGCAGGSRPLSVPVHVSHCCDAPDAVGVPVVDMSEPAGVSAGEPAASSSVFMAVLQQLPACTGADGELLTAPFLEACRLVVPVIGAPAHAEPAASLP